MKLMTPNQTKKSGWEEKHCKQHPDDLREMTFILPQRRERRIVCEKSI